MKELKEWIIALLVVIIILSGLLYWAEFQQEKRVQEQIEYEKKVAINNANNDARKKKEQINDRIKYFDKLLDLTNK